MSEFDKKIEEIRIKNQIDIAEILIACQVDLDGILREVFVADNVKQLITSDISLYRWQYSRAKVQRLRMAINERLKDIERR